VRVIGISADSVEKQARFVEKQRLNVSLLFCLQVFVFVVYSVSTQFPVLSDSEGAARKAYHVGKSLFGLFPARVTFLIDSDGIIQYVFNGILWLFAVRDSFLTVSRDVLEATFNYGAHSKFVAKWLSTMQTEEVPAQDYVFGHRSAEEPEETRDEIMIAEDESDRILPTLELERVSEHPPRL
jgi:peroxiredoxin Q/BCP